MGKEGNVKDFQIYKYLLGNILAIYTVVDGTMQFTLVPAGKAEEVSAEKLTLEGRNFNAPDSAVQVHVFGDRVNRQYSAGQTMRNSQSAYALKFAGQQKLANEKNIQIISRLVRDDGQTAEHRLIYRKGTRYVECYTVYENQSDKPVTLEMLSSFSIGSLTPFRMDNGAHAIRVYRMRSQWSSEARLEESDASDFILEPSWMNYGARGERFGSIGTMPAKKFMPFIGLTDDLSGVTWAASLAYAGSWQMEFYMAQDSVNLSGGLADFEFGHWRKVLARGEKLETPHAFLTCVCGSINKAAQYLTQAQIPEIPTEDDTRMPVLYNEYCRNWGKCSRENLLPLIDRAAALGIEYFVIDAGWAEYGFDSSGRSWTVKKEYYPEGIKEIVDYIHSKGMKAGIWFEPESFESESEDNSLPLVRRDGKIVRNLERVFLDMTDPVAIESLERGVIGFLAENHFDYVKFDYNENIGVGCDGGESLGEGLRKQVLGSYAFYRKVKEKLPGLVVEMCSSGGMRCEPSMIALGDMMSFSDIHETPDEASVACDMQRVLYPSKSQIWSTLHETYSDVQLIYTLACGFYGRMCISGFIDKLDVRQLEIVRRAIETYRLAALVIRRGVSSFVGKTPPQRHLEKYRGCIRTAEDGNTVLTVIHIFDDSVPELKLRAACFRGMKLVKIFAPEEAEISLEGETLTAKGLCKLSAFVAIAGKSGK